MSEVLSAQSPLSLDESAASTPAAFILDRAVVSSAPPSISSKQWLRLQFQAGIFALDCASLVTAFLLAGYFRHGLALSPPAVSLLLIVLPVYSLLALQMKAYGVEIIRKPRIGLYRALVSLAATMGVVLLVAFFLKATEDLSRAVFGAGILVSAYLIGVLRFLMGNFGWRALRGNPFNELVLVDGAYFAGQEHVHVIDVKDIGLAPNPLDPYMLDRLGQVLENVDRVVVACAPERRAVWALLLKGANVQGEVLSTECEQVGAIGVGRIGERVTLAVSCGPLDLRSRALKRTLDLAVAAPLLFFLAPLFMVMAVMIKLESPGPVFFVQRRVGRGNRMFPMLKFRSMHLDACDADGARSASIDDDRVTQLGRFLRKSSIDELPQLINVVRGEMSLVGPRPHALRSLAGDQLFWEVDERYWHRHACKPGITGLAQVRGYRGATRERCDLTNRLKADLEYLSGWSIWRDIAILVRTLRVLIHPRAF